MQTLLRTEPTVGAPEPIAEVTPEPVRAHEIVPAPTRRHDLDWLRVLAVLLLIPFHSARVFDLFDDFYVKSAHTSEGLSWAIVAFLDPWHMPLLFVLAGAASWYALGHRSGRTYAGERTKRLFVPFLFGLLVIVPPQTYLAQWSKGIEPTMGFWDFSGDLTGYTGGFTPAHLWFIAFLFGFSFLALPLFLRWRRRPIGARWLLFAMPVVLLLANELPAAEDGNQSPWYSIALFIGGFLLVADPRAERLIHRAWTPLLATAVVTMTTAMLVWHAGIADRLVEGSAAEAGWALFELVNVWVWVLALLGVGHAFLNRENRVLRYANTAAYPFYLLHQTVIVAVAFAVVRWEIGAWAQFPAIVLASFGISLGLYEFVIRRANVTRFLFGLKPRPRARTYEGR
jgi:peptidoglycan/LPS O-acetylase OafA/YrhL